MQSCVDEAWFQRPDQQQGPFFFGGGEMAGNEWQAIGLWRPIDLDIFKNACYLYGSMK
jgi:hypothetical protein